MTNTCAMWCSPRYRATRKNVTIVIFVHSMCIPMHVLSIFVGCILLRADRQVDSSSTHQFFITVPKFIKILDAFSFCEIARERKHLQGCLTTHLKENVSPMPVKQICRDSLMKYNFRCFTKKITRYTYYLKFQWIVLIL